jgi:hypothetical protein
VLEIGALDCPVCHQTLSGAPGSYRCQPATLGKTKTHSAIIHRTVRCATGLSSESAGNGYPAPTVDSANCYSELQCHARSQSREVRGHRTVRCRKKTKHQWSTSLRTLTFGWCGGAPDNAQCLSDGAPNCPVRPSLTASPTATQVVGGYKYPQPPQPLVSKFSEDHIQYKSSSIHSKTQYKRSNPLQAPNSFQTLSGLWEREIFVFIWVLIAWIAFLLFPFLFSSAL